MNMLAIVSLIAATAVVLNLFRLIRNAADRGLSFGKRLALLAGDAGVVSLADAALGAVSDIDLNVINEFRKGSWLLNNLVFDDAVNPAGGGATLTYGYTRQITQVAAAFRAINAEYTPAEVTRQQFTTNLRPLGGSFQVDRVLANIGPSQATEVELQMGGKITASMAKFTDAVINGDTAVDANGFDGLDKALTGSTTELHAGTLGLDLTTSLDSTSNAVKALKAIDDALAVMDAPPDVVIGPSEVISFLRAAAKITNQYVQNVVDFTGAGAGAQGTVESYGNLTLLDPGTKSGSNTKIVATRSATVGGQAGTYGDLYFVRLGLDGFHGVSLANRPLVQTWMPDFTHAGAVKTGEVELGPVSVALKATRAAAVLRNVRVA